MRRETRVSRGSICPVENKPHSGQAKQRNATKVKQFNDSSRRPACLQRPLLYPSIHEALRPLSYKAQLSRRGTALIRRLKLLFHAETLDVWRPWSSSNYPQVSCHFELYYGCFPSYKWGSIDQVLSSC